MPIKFSSMKGDLTIYPNLLYKETIGILPKNVYIQNYIEIHSVGKVVCQCTGKGEPSMNTNCQYPAFSDITECDI